MAPRVHVPHNYSVDGKSGGRCGTLGASDVALIADAFELAREAVAADAAVVAGWAQSDGELLAHLQTRRDWDDSLTPFYLSWLRGEGDAAAR
jgi:hypothetical protein